MNTKGGFGENNVIPEVFKKKCVCALSAIDFVSWGIFRAKGGKEQ